LILIRRPSAPFPAPETTTSFSSRLPAAARAELRQCARLAGHSRPRDGEAGRPLHRPDAGCYSSGVAQSESSE
jgi:hypothetical protein